MMWTTIIVVCRCLFICSTKPVGKIGAKRICQTHNLNGALSEGYTSQIILRAAAYKQPHPIKWLDA